MTYFFNETKGIYIDETNGAAYYTTRGAARALGIKSQTLDYQIGTAKIEGVKTAEVLTVQGLRTAKIIPATSVYELAIEFNKDLAIAMGKAGAVAFAHHEAGWKAKEVKPMSQAELALWTVQQLVEQEKQLTEVKEDVNRLKQFAPTEDYYTLTAYYNYRKQPWDKSRSAAKDGKELVKLSKQMNYDVKPVHDARYNNVNSYHIDVLQAYLGF